MARARAAAGQSWQTTVIPAAVADLACARTPAGMALWEEQAEL